MGSSRSFWRQGCHSFASFVPDIYCCQIICLQKMTINCIQTIFDRQNSPGRDIPCAYRSIVHPLAWCEWEGDTFWTNKSLMGYAAFLKVIFWKLSCVKRFLWSFFLFIILERKSHDAIAGSSVNVVDRNTRKYKLFQAAASRGMKWMMFPCC